MWDFNMKHIKLVTTDFSEPPSGFTISYYYVIVSEIVFAIWLTLTNMQSHLAMQRKENDQQKFLKYLRFKWHGMYPTDVFDHSVLIVCSYTPTPCTICLKQINDKFDVNHFVDNNDIFHLNILIASIFISRLFKVVKYFS